MEISKTECKRILRTLELKAYRSVVDALRAQGALTADRHEVLKNLAATLKVGEERYRSEMRRAANDDFLNTIAQSTSGENSESEWRAESAKKVPLTPMVASHTAFTVLADAISDIVSLENEKFSDSGKSNNVLESYKLKNDDNLEKYQSSKALNSLLLKRKNHHQNSILSELENIKLNNNYHSSPIKSGYIEISYDEPPSTVDSPNRNFSFEDTNSSFDAPTSPSFEKSNSSGRNSSPRKFEDAKILNKLERKKSRLKLKRGETKNNGKKTSNSNVSQIQNIGRKRNLRSKPSRKYTWNSVEIRSFGDENAEEAHSSKFEDKPLKDTRSISDKKLDMQNSKESRVEISYSESGNNSSIKSKRSKQRNRRRTNFVRQSKISRVRKLAPSSKGKIDAVKEVQSRTARFSSRNARRRNYARIASGDYDLLEFEKIRKEKKIENVQIKTEPDESKESDDDTLSDSSAAPIEISYGVPSAPKSSDYDLDGVSSNYTETDDDMKPHTFNLIPASRRLKMLKKRASSPLGEETPVKLMTLSSPSTEEQVVIQTAKTSLLDANALKKVLAAHESSGTVTSSSSSDASDIADTKDTLDTSDRLHSSCGSSEVKVTKLTSLTSSRCVTEKKSVKPKMKLSEASTIENLHSLLFKVKEGDVKRFPPKSINKKKAPLKRKKDRTSIIRPASPIVNNCNGALIEVGSDTSSPKNTNCDASVESKGTEDQTRLENSDKMQTKLKLMNEGQESQDVLINEEEIVSVTLDDIETPQECGVSEQLIDIESADIIIGDSDDQNGEFILPNNDAVILGSNINNKLPVPIEAIEVLQPSTTADKTDQIKEQKNDVIENSKRDENAFAIRNDSTLLEKSGVNIKPKMSTSVDSSSFKKKVLPTSTDFRYIADADDPSLKKVLSKSSSDLLPTAVPPRIATIINSSKKFGKQSTNNATHIIINNAKIVNNGSTLLQNNISAPSLTNNSTFPKDGQFVLLRTSSITGSKSLLKSYKIFPKTVISNQVTTDINCVTQKPKTLAVYSSLSNARPSSVGSKTVKDAVVSSSGDKAKLAGDESVVTKSTSEVESKRLVLSQALESSLKLIGTSKTPLESSSTNVLKNPESSKNNDKMIEISSNDLSESDQVSKDDNSGSVSSTTATNNFDILYTDGVLLSDDKSNDVSSTKKLSEMQTFFSKNIIRKQS